MDPCPANLATPVSLHRGQESLWILKEVVRPVGAFPGKVVQKVKVPSEATGVEHRARSAPSQAPCERVMMLRGEKAIQEGSYGGISPFLLGEVSSDRFSKR